MTSGPLKPGPKPRARRSNACRVVDPDGSLPESVNARRIEILFAIIFGLSMDYEVFIVSRIHEEWVRSHNPSAAVHHGMSTTGRVITAAATIMICVFASFAVGDNRDVKLFGISMASAVFLDAFVVRSLLLPSVLQLLGPRTWWMPDWLRRRTPQISIDAKIPSLTPVLKERWTETHIDRQGDRFAGPDSSGHSEPVGPVTAEWITWPWLVRIEDALARSGTMAHLEATVIVNVAGAVLPSLQCPLWTSTLTHRGIAGPDGGDLCRSAPQVGVDGVALDRAERRVRCARGRDPVGRSCRLGQPCGDLTVLQ
jgi:MMPL family